jgi:L-alanine-DL-glutamate epimerase-like enolase superfamily enzyme
MRIEDIRCYLVEEPDHARHRWRDGLPGAGDGTPAGDIPRVAYIRIDTDEGITGALRLAKGEATLSLVRRRLKRLIGEDPLMTERLWQLIWEIDRVEEMQLEHLGICDLIAWDIKSRKAGLPLYQLLGGHRRRVPAYASTVTWETIGEYERHIKECVDLGFGAFKLHAWGRADEDARLVRELRKWVGPDADLMFDASGGWDYVTALRFGRVLENEGYLWYEEPMREFDLTSYRKLCDALDIPVLAAETADGCHWNAATWIDMGGLDMLRTNPWFKGGMTGALKIAHLAEAHGMRAQVHGMGHAQAQLCGAIPNNDYYEQLVVSSEQIDGLAGLGPLAIENGFLTVPDAPGLCLDPDWPALERRALAIA